MYFAPYLRHSLAIILFSCLLVSNIFAQVEFDHEFSCGTQERHDHLMRTDATYRLHYLQYQERMNAAIASGTGNRSMQVEYTIPVVVHVIHLGEPVGTGSNISDAQILDAINGLNNRYSNANGAGADMEIQFCMATQTPNGCPTNGIVRVDGSGVANYTAEGIEYDGTCGADELTIKNLSRWSVFDYYNIWVVHDICGNWAGYAYYPNGGSLDGTVIGAAYMNSTGKTLAHELGHALDIRHTFHGDGDGTMCPENVNCGVDGDLICDTPPHKRDDCGMSNPCTGTGDWLNSRYNWMSYCSTPANLGRFTEDQRTRMHAAMNDYPRDALQNSIGCSPIDLPWITSDNDDMCEGDTRELTAEPGGGVFVVLSGPGEIEGDILTATGQGIINIQYTTCSFSVTQHIESFQTPDPFFTSTEDPLCTGATRLLLASPPGGDFNLISGPASLVGNVLLAEEAGTAEVEYSITANGCTGSALQDIDLVPTPMPEITSSNEAMCVGAVRLLTGIPGGGEYVVISGSATVNGNELTATGSGILTIGYTVEDNACTGSTTQSIVVNVSPMPSITSPNLPLCSGEERVLTGLPAGGMFAIVSGPASLVGDTLTSTGAGDIILQYAVVQNGCTGIATQPLNSQASPAPAFSNTDSMFCISQPLVLTANPGGGSYGVVSGPGAISADTLSATGEGIIVVGYTIVQNGCSGYVEQQFSAVSNPAPVIASDTSAMCSGDSRTLIASPDGGTYSVIGGEASLDSNVLTAVGAGVIQYAYTVNLNGCIGVDTQQLISYLTPAPVISITDISLCNGSSIALSGSPAGGVYEVIAGPGIIAGDVLTAIDTGRIDFVYSVTENNCTGSVEDEAAVLPQPVADVLVNDNVLTSANENVAYQWLYCNPGYEVIQGAVDLSFSVTTTGSYALAVQDGFCVDTSECILVEVTSTEDGHGADQFVIYPNPVEDKLYVEHGGVFAHVNITITDIHGRRILIEENDSPDNIELNVSDFAAGLYVLMIEVPGEVRFQYKFVRI